jgi:hypothetical protein
MEDFEVQSHSPLDVFEVAVWQHAWNGPTTKDWRPPATGSWRADFEGNFQLARLIIIDGKFYSPLKYLNRVDATMGTVLATNFIPHILKSQHIYSVTGEYLTSFKSGTWANTLARGDFMNLLDESGTMPAPDLTNRSPISDTLEETKSSMRRWLDLLAVVDGMVWAQIEEPVVAVYHSPKATRIEVAEKRKSANAGRISYFSFNDFEAAVECYESHLGGEKEAYRDVANLTVLMPQAFKHRVEEDQLLAKVDHLVETLQISLPVFPKDVAPFWYELRDELAARKINATDEQLEILKERALDLCAAINNSNLDDKVKAKATIGITAAERWELRPI